VLKYFNLEIGAMPRRTRSKWFYACLCVTLMLSSFLSAQESPDTTGVSSESSLLEQVFEHRITLLQDSLFLAQERIDAANFLAGQLETRIESLTDSLQSAQLQANQFSDSLTNMLIEYDRLQAENEQNLGRLNALSDSIALSFDREDSLKNVGDSLQIILARTQSHLGLTSGSQRAYADTVRILRTVQDSLRKALIDSEERVAGMYDQLRMALTGSAETTIDSAVDEKLMEYLRILGDYHVESSGIAKLFQSRDADMEVFAFKLGQVNEYLERVALQGNTPEALNVLAETYIIQEDELRGSLTFLKTLFLFPDTEAGLYANGRLEELVESSSELGRLYYEVALIADSMQVGEERFYKYLNYLQRIRSLSNSTMREWFIDEAQRFLLIYPGILQADMILVWVAQTHHALEQYHSEILTYMKIRELYQQSRFIPEVTYNIAEVTAENLKNFQLGVARYERFHGEFPEHEKASAARLAEAIIYEEEIKDYQKAGELYRSLADVYPEDALAPISLFRYADLLRDKLGASPGALAVYNELLTNYGEDPASGIPALEGMASISQENRQYDAAVAFYLDIHQRYPEETDRAVNAILVAAEIYESDLKNIDATIHTLHIVLDNYPEHSSIKSVQRQVQKLQKKKG
jgi:TolA-binding protein